LLISREYTRLVGMALWSVRCWCLWPWWPMTCSLTTTSRRIHWRPEMLMVNWSLELDEANRNNWKLIEHLPNYLSLNWKLLRELETTMWIGNYNVNWSNPAQINDFTSGTFLRSCWIFYLSNLQS
jgi:hypothetical protein